MKIFLDTANIQEIRQAKCFGTIDGVTTNPSLITQEIKRTGKSREEILKNICEEIDGAVSAEVLGMSCEDMIKEAKELVKISPNIVIKIPIMDEGLKAIKHLSKENIKTNATLCFSPLQALMVAKAGTTYVSPFVGRLDDIGEDGIFLIQQIKQIYFNYQIPTEIIVASIRNPIHILRAALIGADIVTVPFKVLQHILKHPKTEEGIKKFLEDAKSIPIDDGK